MKTLLTILAIFPTTVLAKPQTTISCEKHPIFCDILTVKPSINRSYAMELSNYINKWSSYYGTNPKHSVAIAMQESSLINQDRKGTVITKEGKKVRGVTDVGVFQIHIETIANMNERLNWEIDFQRLRSDIEYQTQIHTRVLRRKIKICSSAKYKKKLKVKSGREWACYHSFTPKKRAIYFKDVSEHLNKISNPILFARAPNSL